MPVAQRHEQRSPARTRLVARPRTWSRADPFAPWSKKQGGKYELTQRKTQWEWFSLRFDDDEQMMLFTFPHMGYYDGTYIRADGAAERLNDYTLQRTRTIEHSGKTWSAGWDLHVPGRRDERYSITPRFDGNINFSYFEELCDITDAAGTRVGFAFVELLPGVHNESSRTDLRSLLTRIEY